MWIAASAGMMDPFFVFHSGGARLISDSFLRPIAALFSFD